MELRCKEFAMPIYEFECKECKKEFEKLVFAGDDPQVECPACKSRNVRKQMSASSFMAGSKGMGSCATTPASGGFG